MKKLKKVMASVLAATTMAVGMTAVSANAAYGTTSMGGYGTGYLSVSSTSVYAYTEGSTYEEKNVAVYAIKGDVSQTSASKPAYNEAKVTVQVLGTNITHSYSDHETGSSGTYTLSVAK